jgi:hypothetical protein
MLIKLSEAWRKNQAQAKGSLGNDENSSGPAKLLPGPAGGSQEKKARKVLELPIPTALLIGPRTHHGLEAGGSFADSSNSTSSPLDKNCFSMINWHLHLMNCVLHS